ncbi:uncharacterized protein LOC119593678 [Penaeus monodon]|uniref:uncharacterized protein LOC119593678 n=1 Tax=Penaeus monodon TaxID=6687 RepID=UPI0018A6FCC8|nr:uncharacterized protein LOC119593678 [Penaeus monodon]
MKISSTAFVNFSYDCSATVLRLDFSFSLLRGRVVQLVVKGSLKRSASGKRKMGRLSAILLVLFLTSTQLANALLCYECFGFDESKPFHVITNNPSCVTGAFDASQVNLVQSSVNATHPYCAAFSAMANGVVLTARSSFEGLREVKEVSTGYLNGYICNDADNCNGRDTSAARSRSIMLALLVLPAAVVRMLS